MRTVRNRPDEGRRVLVLSASMGAGHDGAARELARRLQASGHHAEVRDFLEAGPLHIGTALRNGYEFELRHVPGAYDATYRFWHRVPWLCPAVAWLVTALTGRRVRRWVREARADVVVSTYPLAALCLGRLRRGGRLTIPAVGFITDFGVHPLWVHRGLDLTLTVHDAAARAAAARTGRRTVACGPLVADRFARPVDRAAERDRLGLAHHDRAVLVVAGSWGVGDIDDTISDVAAAGAVPVVVCGRDDALATRIRAHVAKGGLRAVVLGWSDRMPELIGACDAVVENAGGLTAFEAMRAGVPVVSYNPIAGHGVDNTAAMAAAGVSTLATDATSLRAALGHLSVGGEGRDAQVRRAAGMFRCDGAALVAAVPPAVTPLRSVRAITRGAAAVTALVALGWMALTTGVGVAAAEGAGVAHPPASAGAVAYVGVRLDGAGLADPAVAGELLALHASVVLDRSTAVAAPDAVRRIVASGLTVVDGGAGGGRVAEGSGERTAPWSRARADVLAGAALARLTGRRVALFAPGRRITAWDLYDCSDAHLSAVVPDALVRAPDERGEPAVIPTLHAHEVVLVVGTTAPPAVLAATLVRLEAALAAARVTPAPLTALQG